MAKTRKRAGLPRVFRGIAVAPGIAIGPARFLEEPGPVEERRVAAAAVEGEILRFEAALDRAREELRELRRVAAKDLGDEDARIFDVQLLVLQDPLAVERTVDAIRAERRNAEFLWSRHMHEVVDQLSRERSPFADRGVDLLDVKRRVLRHLRGRPGASLSALRRGVLLSRELAPSDALQIDPLRILGFATDQGGRTSHAAIMARARGIPAVVGLKGLSEAVREGDVVALDGFRGQVEVHPSPRTLEQLRARRRSFRRLEQSHARLVRLPAETTDGHRISLLANMETPAEADFIRARGAEGVGLFRTEFFFMWRPSAPNEDEQVEAYRKVLDAFHPQPVVIRALDVGGDKLASYMGMAREQNPFLGLRGIRYLLAHPDVFRTQLQAVLRAGAGRRSRILLPMIHCVRELEDTREILARAMSTLRRRREPFDPRPELGVMIEVPSAVLMADELAREADFLSVGSNDLIQYLLAIDRDNEALVRLYQPQHPAVVRALSLIVEAARRHGRSVSMCGEMASDPLSLPLLVGLGFDRLSVSPFMIPGVKQTVRSLGYEECRALAQEALGAKTADQVAALTERRLGSRFSDLLSLIREVNGTRGDSPRARARAGRPGA